MICIIPLASAENILKKMGTTLEKDFSIFAFGIYTLEEINEIRKSMQIEKPIKKVNFTKDFYIIMPPLEKLNRNKHQLNSIIFKKVKDLMEKLKAEEERKKIEEEENEIEKEIEKKEENKEIEEN